MKKLNERSQWENEWADAFRNEEQKAPAPVWHNIDAVLANKEAKKYKKRAVFYKWVAAASVLVSACGAVLLFLSSPQTSPQSEITGISPVEQTAEKQPSLEVAENAPTGTEARESAGEMPEASREITNSATAVNTSPDDQLVEGSKKTRTMGQNAEAVADGTKGGREAENSAGSLAMASDQEPKQSDEGFGQLEDKAGSFAKQLKPEASESLETEGNAIVVQRRRKPSTSSGENRMEAGNDQSFSALPIGSERELAISAAENSSVQGAGNHLEVKSALNSSSALAFLELEKKGMVLEEPKPAGLDIRVQKVWMASDLLKKKSEGEVPRYWLGASLATNSFNPNFQQGYSPASSPAGFASLDQSVAKPEVNSRIQGAKVKTWDETQEAMVSFAGGVQGAAWLSEKWIVQGGLQYGTYKSSGKAGAFVDKNGSGAYPLHYSNFDVQRIDPLTSNSGLSGDISAINTFEFLSVPLSIGYVVLDQKVGLIVAPGLSSEFFLSNNLSDAQNILNDYEVKGSESPYNLVHLRGSMGLQLFYRVGESYIVSLEPAYQHSITDFNKSESNFSSRPSNITLGAGFKYIIR